MADETKSGPDDIIPANDNQGPESEASKRVDRVALTLARIIGRRMAREDFDGVRRRKRQQADRVRENGGRGRQGVKGSPR